jgi:predicted small metal-binding protein
MNGEPPPSCDGNKRKVEDSNNSGDLTALHCPICMQIFSGKVFQCSSGHPICEDCKGKLPGAAAVAKKLRCPTCRGALRDIRNRVVEELIASGAFCSSGEKRMKLEDEGDVVVQAVEVPAIRVKCVIPSCEWEFRGVRDEDVTKAEEEHYMKVHKFLLIETVNRFSYNSYLQVQQYTDNEIIWKLILRSTTKQVQFLVIVIWKVDEDLRVYCIELGKKTNGTMRVHLSGHDYNVSWGGPHTCTRNSKLRDVQASCNYMLISDNRAKLLFTGKLDKDVMDSECQLRLTFSG